MFGEKDKVLFLCESNSARSQMAESLLRRYAGERFEISSAGLHPTEVHPLTYQVLNESGIDTGGLRAKGIEEFLAKARFRYAIIVCEESDKDCPHLYPFAVQTLYWPFEDPTKTEGSEETRIAKFREVRDRIAQRILSWLEEVDRT
jgi:arsenate reductase (thioredoxin)